MVQSEHNLKNIRKSLKRSLNNNFVRNLNVYSKGHNQIHTKPHPFKGLVTISGCFFYTAKAEHNLKNNPKYDKNNLTNNFVENLQV